MKLSAKTRYALKAVTELSKKYDNQNKLRLSEIARLADIPPQFLVQLMLKLKSAGIVNSLRGFEGGYVLAKHPCQISVLDVCNAIDDKIVSVDRPGKQDKLEQVLGRVWDEAGESFNGKLAQVNFQEVALELKKGELNFHI